MTENSQNKTWIVLIVAILSLACVISVSCIVFGTPIAKKLAERIFETPQPDGIEINFEGSFQGAAGEQGYQNGVTFVSGHSGKGVLFNEEDTLHYQTDNNISPYQGSIEFWLRPTWNGGDNQSYVFFEIGNAWFNRFRIIKDGANNFRFMVWSAEVEYDAACNVSNWRANEWHHIRATWEGDEITLSLDEILCDKQTYVVLPDYLSAQFYIGSSAKQDLQAQAVIDEFIIRTQP
jgi:hypothetical protein